MAAPLQQVLRLEVPVVVRLGERSVPLSDVLSWVPGALIELPKKADSELELLINNRHVGFGTAVKVGENFGIRLTYVGEIGSRVAASPKAAAASPDEAAM
jgi:flagellar motor switch protein FliN